LQLRHRAHYFRTSIVELRLEILDLGVPRQNLELETGNALVLISVAHGYGVVNDAWRRSDNGFRLRRAGRANSGDG
jgi:hypothetical protein